MNLKTTPSYKVVTNINGNLYSYLGNDAPLLKKLYRPGYWTLSKLPKLKNLFAFSNIAYARDFLDFEGMMYRESIELWKAECILTSKQVSPFFVPDAILQAKGISYLTNSRKHINGSISCRAIKLLSKVEKC